MAGKIAHGQLEGMGINVIADILHHQLPGSLDKIFLQVTGNTFHGGKPDDNHGDQF